MRIQRLEGDHPDYSSAIHQIVQIFKLAFEIHIRTSRSFHRYSPGMAIEPPNLSWGEYLARVDGFERDVDQIAQMHSDLSNATMLSMLADIQQRLTAFDFPKTLETLAAQVDGIKVELATLQGSTQGPMAGIKGNDLSVTDAVPEQDAATTESFEATSSADETESVSAADVASEQYENTSRLVRAYANAQ